MVSSLTLIKCFKWLSLLYNTYIYICSNTFMSSCVYLIKYHTNTINEYTRDVYANSYLCEHN